MRRGIVKKREEGKRERNREINKQRDKETKKQIRKEREKKKEKRKQRFFLYILKDDTKSNKFVIKSEVRKVP